VGEPPPDRLRTCARGAAGAIGVGGSKPAGGLDVGGLVVLLAAVAAGEFRCGTGGFRPLSYASRVQFVPRGSNGVPPPAERGYPLAKGSNNLRGVNTLGFQIASRSSTAISTFRPTPPPAVPLWTLKFQPRGPCGSPFPRS
jgi:hypothetical protein